MIDICRWYRLCPMRRFEAQGILDTGRTDFWRRGGWSSCARFKAEESGRYHPDNLFPDGTIDANLS